MSSLSLRPDCVVLLLGRPRTAQRVQHSPSTQDSPTRTRTHQPRSPLVTHTHRAENIRLVKNWYLEHCPPCQPVVIHVSYQKLLKCSVLNELKRRHPKTMVKNMFF
ncbi:hypothetical protein EXIGLDRAFT_770802 [Exidia glandulosa HHB12029]|uniref:PROCN domain-containing protein n=1 Tax=Exidia glandulosa HHB12029 TaxID=1314781 RepID=A0A165GGB0_EXIGL|nr:hypothetical protein EXIGLDRAFT_770802 [Exidia glandulosa HHB12029]